MRLARFGKRVRDQHEGGVSKARVYCGGEGRCP